VVNSVRKSRGLIAGVVLVILIVAWVFSKAEPFPGGRGARLVFREAVYVNRPEIYEVYELVGTPQSHIESALQADGYRGKDGAMRKKRTYVLIRDGAYQSVSRYYDLPPIANTTPREGYLTITTVREDKSFLSMVLDSIFSW